MYPHCRRIGIVFTVIFLSCYFKPTYIVYDIIPFNGGKAILMENNIAITAAHLLNYTSEEIYKDIENDIAIVKINRKLSVSPTKRRLKIYSKGLKIIDYSPYFGQSGDAYTQGNTFEGIIIGKKDNKGVIFCIDRGCYKWILKKVS